MGFLQGKRALVTGIASQRSIATGIADAFHREGAELALTYQNEKLKSRVEDAAAGYGSKIVLPLDVADDAQIDACFDELGKHWGDGFDILVHCIAFAPREAIEGDFLDGITRERYHIAHDISAYSLAALGKAARPLMKGRNGSVLTLSYLGAERALANYNTMGVAKAGLEAATRYIARDLGPQQIRVNAISAGAMRTLSLAGISGGRGLHSKSAQFSLIKEETSMEGVAGAALWLCSDLGRSTTGEVVHVDAGFHMMGLAGDEE